MSVVTELADVRQEQARLASIVEEQSKLVVKTDEQINGERGLSAAINANTAEVRGMRRAMYWVAGLIVAGSITMAFSALQLVGGH